MAEGAVVAYATTDDVIAYRGPQSAEALERLPAALEAVSAQFRVEARNRGRNLDEIIGEDADIRLVTKCLVVDGAMNYISSTTGNDVAMTQITQAAGGYSVGGTFLNPGGGLYTKKQWLKLLGVSRQRVSTLEVFDLDPHPRNPR